MSNLRPSSYIVALVLTLAASTGIAITANASPGKFAFIDNVREMFGTSAAATRSKSRIAPKNDPARIANLLSPEPRRSVFATTYTWNQGASGGNFGTASNWTPARTSPAADDILVFSTGSSNTITNVTTQTIGQLQVTGGAAVSLWAGAASQTLTVSGGAQALSVDAGSTLQLGGTNALTLNVATGSKGTVSGSVILSPVSSAAHRLTAADVSGITFSSGASFLAGGAMSGAAFGSATGTVVFASGSTFTFQGGSTPFPAAVFQTGSLYSHQSSNAPSFSGRTYANFELKIASGTQVSVSGTNAVSIDNLTITQGILNFNMTGNPGHSLKGNISVASGGALNFNPTTAATFNLNGSAEQIISGSGTLTMSNPNSTWILNNSNNLTLLRDVTVSNLSLTSGNITTNTATLSISPSGGVTRTSGYIIGNLNKNYLPSVTTTYEVGTLNGYTPVYVFNPTGGTAGTLTVSAKQGTYSGPAAGLPANRLSRWWTLTLTGGGGSPVFLGFTYLPGDVTAGNEGNYKAFRISGGTATQVSSDTNVGGYTTNVSAVSTFSGDWTTAEVTSPPSANSSAATNVKSLTATLNGSANPNGSTATGWFRYSTTNPGACNDTFGDRAPAPTGGSDLGSGSSTVNYSQNLTGLTPGATYYYCAIASNAGGTAFGGLLTFNTVAAPAVTTQAANPVGHTTATLRGSAVIYSTGSSAWFRYSTEDPGTCSDSFGTKVPSGLYDLGGAPPPGFPNQAKPYSHELTGLQPGTTYYYCALVSDNPPTVTGFGQIVSFTTTNIFSLSVNPSSVNEAGNPTVSLIASAAAPVQSDTTVTIEYSNTSTASTGDFQSAIPNSITIPAGQSSGSVQLQILDDGSQESAETATFNGTVGAQTFNTSLTIEDNDVPPAITGLNPTSGSTVGGTTVTITGTGFTGATAVNFGANAATAFTVNGDTQITATAPAGSAGTVDVSVTTALGTSANTANDNYTYVAAPAITSLSPTSGPTTGGNSVVITGSNLSGATAVNFGANPATSFTVDSATQITATAPAGAAATVDVSVTTVGGTSANTANDNYTYLAPPTVSATSPTDGATGVVPTTSISVTFDQAMNPATITTSGGTNCIASLQISADNFVTCLPTGFVSPSAGNTVFTVTPSTPLSFGTTYKIRVTTDAQSAGGIPLASIFTQAAGFTTVSCTPPNVVYVDDNFANPVVGQDPDGAGPATQFGCDSFATIQGGVNGVTAGGTVHVRAGTYNEDVTIANPGIHVLGAGPAAVTVSGPIGGSNSTFFISANNVELAGLTITRDGNNTTDWNNPGLNSAGIALAQGTTGVVIHDNIITGNRTGIDINNSGGHTVRNNVIDFNRTGMIFRNQTNFMTVTENLITNNWTVGILFLDGSVPTGSNTPVNEALHSNFNNNKISGNWYGQVVDRQTGGSLPAPGANPKDFRYNWWGTVTPVVTTANSAEPGYAGQIPVAYGGTATPPGGQPDIAGPASANIIYQPVLTSGSDTNIETAPGRGTFGFQGVQAATVVVTSNNLNGWVSTANGTASTSFVQGPATPPLGVGSGQLSVGSDGNSGAQFRQTGYNGTLLSDITQLSYSSYTSSDTSAPAGDQSPYIILNVDRNGDNVTDTLLFFEPEYQHGHTNAVPDQGDNLMNTWQTWDARAGGWYAIDSSTFAPVYAGPGAGVLPLDGFITAFPTAVLTAPVSGAGSLRLVAGFGAPTWDNYVGNIDNVQVGVAGNITTYDFEPLIADLAITKTDNDTQVRNGDTQVYTIVVTNNGPEAANGAIFTDPAVAGLNVTSVTCGSATGGAVCPDPGNTTVALMQGSGIVIPTLPSGGSVTFSVTATVTGFRDPIVNTANIAPPSGIVDAGPGASSASDTNTFVPMTASDVTLSGSVRTADARGIANATVTVSGGSLRQPVTVSTGRNGNYSFLGLEAGHTYLVSVTSRRFSFAQPSRAVTLADNTADVNFVATP